MKRFLTVLMIMVMIPYVTTMAWTGRIGGGDFTGFEELAGAGEKEARAALWELMGTEWPEGGMWLWSGKERFRGSRRRIFWSMCWRPRSRQISGRRL